MLIKLSPHFLRQFKKLSRKDRDIVSGKIEILRKNVFSPTLRTHQLSGKMKNSYSFSITYAIRTVFVLQNAHTILLVSVGSHDAVYRE